MKVSSPNVENVVNPPRAVGGAGGSGASTTEHGPNGELEPIPRVRHAQA